MTALTELVEELATLHTEMADRLRKIAKLADAESSTGPTAPFTDRVLRAARRLHESIGPRQLEVLRHIADAHPEGVTTGDLVRLMHYDQANIYLTLKSLWDRNYLFVRRDETVKPHRYYLSPKLLGEVLEGD